MGVVYRSCCGSGELQTHCSCHDSQIAGSNLSGGRRDGDGTMSVMESEATYDLTDEEWTVALSIAKSAAAVLEYDRDTLKRFWTEAINEGQVGPVIREWAQLADRLSDVVEMTLAALEQSKRVLEDLGYPQDDDDLRDSRLN